MTHTFVGLEVSAAAYDEIAAKLRDAGYDNAFTGAVDMHGIGLVRAPAPRVEWLRSHCPVHGWKFAGTPARECICNDSDSQRASSSAGSADAVSPNTSEGGCAEPSGPADQLQPYQRKWCERWFDDVHQPLLQRFRPAMDQYGSVDGDGITPMLEDDSGEYVRYADLVALRAVATAAGELESIMSKLVKAGETEIKSSDIAAAALVERLNALVQAIKAVRP